MLTCNITMEQTIEGNKLTIVILSIENCYKGMHTKLFVNLQI